MQNFKGGYIILDLSAENVYEQATNCLNSTKAIQIVDGTKVYYASFISIDAGTHTITVTSNGVSIDITSNGVVTSTDTTPHLYRVTFVDSDLNGFIDLPVNVGELSIDASAEEITDDKKEVLNKLIGLNVNFPITSGDTSWLSPIIRIETSSSFLTIEFAAIVNGAETSATYTFNIVDGVISSLNNISDNTFGDGLNITTTQLF